MTTERRTPVQAVRVELLCDCGGTMRRQSSTLATSAIRWLYECEACHKQEVHRGEPYPMIVYEPIELDQNQISQHAAPH